MLTGINIGNSFSITQNIYGVKMKRLNVFSAILFVAAAVIFAAYTITERMNNDTAVPVITVNDELISISVNDPEEALLKGITASDAKDGDVTDSIVVESISNFYGDKKRIVSYAAFDSDMNVSKASREIEYNDYQPPEFTLSSPLRFRIGSTNLLDGFGAVDSLDGNISRKIKAVPRSGFNRNIPGTYEVQLEVANSAGDVAYLPVEYEFYENDNPGPRIQLNTYLTYTDPGVKVDTDAFLRSVHLDGQRYYFPNTIVNDAELKAQAEEDEQLYGIAGEGMNAAETPEQDNGEAEATEATGQETDDADEAGDTEEAGNSEETAEEDSLDIDGDGIPDINLRQGRNEISYSAVTVRDMVNYNVPGIYKIYYLMTDSNEETGSATLLVVVRD